MTTASGSSSSTIFATSFSNALDFCTGRLQPRVRLADAWRGTARRRAWADTVWVRRAAARTLAATDRPERVAILAAAPGTLSAGDNGTAHEIAHALVRAGDRSVIATLTGQITAHVPCRHAAAFVLGEFRAREAVGPISEALRNAGRWDLLRAVACAEALGKIGSPQAVPALIAAVDHPSDAMTTHSRPTPRRRSEHGDAIAALRAGRPPSVRPFRAPAGARRPARTRPRRVRWRLPPGRPLP